VGHAQEAAVTRAFELERRGKYAEAAEAYRLVLLRHPTDVSALLGMERSLLPLGRSAEILPQVRSALEAEASLTAAYGIGVRAWGGLGEADSLAALVERWVLVEPGAEAPYREWGRAALRQRDRGAARRAYRLGQQRLGQPGALAADLAQLAMAEQDYAEAAREWVRAVAYLPGHRNAAQIGLGKAPTAARGTILETLTAEELSPVGRRLAASLQARWGEPLAALQLLEESLPDDPNAQMEAFRQFLEQIRGQQSDDAKRARARLLEAIAQRTAGPQNARLRLDAARAFAEGGEAEEARRMLAGLAEDEAVAPELAAGATLTLIRILATEDQLEEAERRLERHEAELGGEEVLVLWRDLAWAWVAAGELDRAEQAIARDNSIDGLAVAGKIRLFRGDLRGAAEGLQAAGPFAGSRKEAVDRTALLALIQPIEVDSLPALGQGLYLLELGDTAQAVSILESVAGSLPAGAGGAELYLLTGRIEVVRERRESGERFLRLADNAEAPATAPAAELELARLLIGQERVEEAIDLLENLIITYSESALVPQARRLLDEVRGAVPRI
jgi:thioredoxin-like negative regulator of GroEL